MRESIDYVETSTDDLIEEEPPAYLSALLFTFIITGLVLALTHNLSIIFNINT